MVRVIKVILTVYFVLLSTVGCTVLPSSQSSGGYAGHRVEPVDNQVVDAAVDAEPDSLLVSDELPANVLRAWWQISFQIKWTEAEEGEDEPEIDWFVGTLIGSEVLAPMVKQYQQELALWRFHRRAKRDYKGHRLSFIFYASQADAEKVVATIKDDLLLAKLVEREWVVDVVYPDTSVFEAAGVSDTADQRWPEEVQATWPQFIMGASKMWLAMAETLVNEYPRETQVQSFEQTVSMYRAVQKDINDMWSENGRHAYFHHMSALFGYERVLVRF